MKKLLIILAYLGSVFVANWAVATFGIIPIGFGLMAPAGVFVIGITLALRDQVHELIGIRGSILALLVGAALSALVSPALALASASAFLVSEFLDLAVYTPLRKRGRVQAVFFSNMAGLVVDSIIFLSLAFGSLEFLPGQIVGKTWATLGAVLFIIAWRARTGSDEVLPRHA